MGSLMQNDSRLTSETQPTTYVHQELQENISIHPLFGTVTIETSLKLAHGGEIPVTTKLFKTSDQL
jgi:hypothetical protein